MPSYEDLTEMQHIRSLGVSVRALSAPDVARWVTERRRHRTLLLNHNLHSVYLFHTDAKFRETYALPSTVIIDGFPVLLAAALERRSRPDGSRRVGSTDWIERLPDHAPRGYRVFVFGASATSNRSAVDELRSRLPECVVEGADGFRDREEGYARVVRTIQSFQPDLVLVGLGMPAQEAFLREKWSELPPAVYATVGGAIDYVAGANKLAPRWMGSLGVEWAWRLAREPSRLWRRYLIEPLKLCGALTTYHLRRSRNASS